ncbi:hypothetical protein [Marinihelvus fidelis]|nr:hypothetical protein [Marinihelvus fidelis]
MILERYEIRSVYEDPDDIDRNTRSSFRTIDAMSADVQFPYIAGGAP